MFAKKKSAGTEIVLTDIHDLANTSTYIVDADFQAVPMHTKNQTDKVKLKF